VSDEREWWLRSQHGDRQWVAWMAHDGDPEIDQWVHVVPERNYAELEEQLRIVAYAAAIYLDLSR